MHPKKYECKCTICNRTYFYYSTDSIYDLFEQPIHAMCAMCKAKRGIKL